MHLYCIVRSNMETLADKLSYEQCETIHEALAATTLKHVKNNGDLFGELGYEPIGNPSQDLRNVHLPAVPTTPADIDGLATLANKRLYPYIRDELLAQGALMGILHKMRNGTREERTHLNIVSTHQTMPDIGLVDVAFSFAEKELYETTDWQTIINTNGLIISRGVATLQAFGLAASEVVQKAGDVFLSFPRTKTIKGLVLPEGINLNKLISDNNDEMKKELKNWLPVRVANLGSTIPTSNRSTHDMKKRTFIAWSGATDEVSGDPFNPDKIQIENANTGIHEHIKHGVVLPLVVWDRGNDKEPIFITGEITKVSKSSDIAKIQEWQRRTLAKRLGLSDELVTVA